MHAQPIPFIAAFLAAFICNFTELPLAHQIEECQFRRRANSIDFRARWALWGISQGLVLNYLISASKTLHGAGKLQERLRKSSRHALRGRYRALKATLWVHSSLEQRTLGKSDWARISPHQCPTKSQSSHTSGKARRRAIFPNTVSRLFLLCPLPPFPK